MNIIKNNPFRILGILVGTSTKEEHAKARKIKMYIEAEQEIPEDFSFPIIGNLDRSLENINDAISKLTLNNDRVNASLFWFYNGNTITDEPMFEAMKSSLDDAKEAVNAWEKLAFSAEITKRNASAFQNLSTLYLNSAFKKNTIYKNKLEKGIGLKLMFLESDFFNDFIQLSSDETYKISKQDLQIYFLNQVYVEIEKIDKDLVDWFIDCISGINFVAKEDFLSNFISKPIDSIKEKIEEVKRKRKENPASAYIVGKELFDFSENKLSFVKNILGKNDLQFTSLSDKISDEILQCGITYFKKYRDTSTDPSDFTMELFSKAKKYAIGSVAKQRCEENTDNLQEWIDEKPERDKQKKIAVDFEKIINILQKYDGKPETVTNADNLLNESIPHLKNIKNVLGVNDQLYLRLSTRIASQALAYIIEDINDVQSNIQHSYQLNNFKTALRNAILAANKIKSLDLEYDFKTNRLNDNYNTLANLCRQLGVSTSSSSSSTTTYTPRPSSQPVYTSSNDTQDEGIPGWLQFVGLIIGIVILVNMCGSGTKNDYNSSSTYDETIDSISLENEEDNQLITNTFYADSTASSEIIDTTTISYDETLSTLELKDIDGVWYGKGDQFDNNTSWNIKLKINSYTNVYQIEYPDLECSGYLRLVNEEKNSIIFEEIINKGVNNCINNLRAELFIIDSNNIKINYYYDGSNELNATGYLTR